MTTLSLVLTLQQLQRAGREDIFPYIRLALKLQPSHPFHNIGHVLHVFVSCYWAARHYGLQGQNVEILLIAALFHDLGHYGDNRPDGENIHAALMVLEQNLQERHSTLKPEIERLIRATEFPYKQKIPRVQLPIEQQILLDADASQVFDRPLFLSTLAGLSEEKGFSLQTLLCQQSAFLKDAFTTAYFKNVYLKQAVAVGNEAALLAHILMPPD